MGSTTSIDPADLELKKLTCNVDPSIFDCTEDDGSDPHGLHAFITKEAEQYLSEGLGITYLAHHGQVPVAFLTMSMTNIPMNFLDNSEQVGEARFPYPAILIGRLAVVKSFRGKSVGTYLTQWGIGLARQVAEKVGCRYVALHTLEHRVSFYTRNPLNFIESSFVRGDGKRLLYRRIIE
ncbi:MAG: GNAT family N-acetyltransferase [Candidatus Bathyarchaeia archaeon]